MMRLREFLEALSSSGGNIAILFVLVLVGVFAKPPDAQRFIDITLGALIGLCTAATLRHDGNQQ